ncbi:MAG: PAS domain S-box protein [Acidobacteria bacterium]|nr:PAS domain S-box protein [Acidobacteriota bacterium]
MPQYYFAQNFFGILWELGFWEQYKVRIIVAIALSLISAVVIITLLWRRAWRKRAQDALRESEARYRQMFEQNRAVKLLIDPASGKIVNANSAAAEFYGYGLEELKRMNITDINTLSSQQVVKEMARVVTEQCSYFIFRHRLASGEVRDVEVHSSPLDEGGRGLLYSIIHDITERLRTEERFRRFFDLPLVGMALTSPQRHYLLVNQKLCDILGYPAHELMRMTWVEVTHPDDIAENARLLEQTIRGETEGYRMDKRFIHRDGHIVYSSISARCVRRDDGAVDHLVLIVEDISERKQAAEALRESEERFRQLAENVDAVFFISEGFSESAPGRVLYVSPSYEKVWGRSRESLYRETRSWFEDVHPDDQERVKAAFPEIAKAKFDEEFRIVRPDGGIRWVHDRVFPIHDDRGEVYRIAGIVEDITERKLVEKELLQSEETLRQLTARLFQLQDEERRRIASELHDSLGQSLAIIKNRAMICLRAGSDPEQVKGQLEEISATAASAIDEVREITHNLRPNELDRLGLVEAIWSMISKVSDSTAIRLSADLDRVEGLFTPEAEMGIYRIVQEGLNNVVRHAEASEARVSIKQVESEVIITVADNGKGMERAEATVNGKGTRGFGLAGIAERARMLGGTCIINSEPGGGTILMVRLSL